MIGYILDRLNETSTWRGVIGVLTGLGVKVRPDLAESIIAAGIALMGIINIFRKEKSVSAASVDTQKP
jgi:F0F1-type ATP synthase assembly protein I